MLIAHLSDLHITLPGEALVPFADSAANLAVAVEMLGEMRPAIDLVVVTGDLVDHGRPAEYERLREILAPLDAPVFAVPGNHDDREIFRTAFAGDGYLPTTGPARFVVNDHAVRIVALDTLLDDHIDGLLDDEALEWLDATLLDVPAQPTLVAMHHPAFDTGIGWMDGGGCRNADGFRAVIERHPQVVRVVAGHVHHHAYTNWGGTIVNTAPSMTYQSHPDLEWGRPRINTDPAGLMLYQWRDGALVGHCLAVRVDRRVIDLPMPNWSRLAPLLQTRAPIHRSVFEH